ncbi:hypothetical protein [Delftia tsuruhatensis]|uniref:hypothetical protein n=1 Tax=Delftia tsuruhatensis TaxID=180282 RepID=UPI003A886CCE
MATPPVWCWRGGTGFARKACEWLAMPCPFLFKTDCDRLRILVFTTASVLKMDAHGIHHSIQGSGMKFNRILAAALPVISLAASAQSSITLFGIVDVASRTIA